MVISCLGYSLSCPLIITWIINLNFSWNSIDYDEYTVMKNIYGGVKKEDLFTYLITKDSPDAHPSCVRSYAFTVTQLSQLKDSELCLIGWRFIIIDSNNSLCYNKSNIAHFEEDICILDQGNFCQNCLLTLKKPISVQEDRFESSVVELKLDGNITGLSCTDNLLVLWTESGTLWILSSLTTPKPEKLFLSDRKVRHVSCGKEHAVVLTTLGQVYTFGGGSRGQLGHGILESSAEPKLVEALSGVFISKIAAGGWHTLALSDIGDVYSWGWNESGQVGMPCLKTPDSNSKADNMSGYSMIMYPSLLFEDDCDVTIESISCGSRHSAAVTEEGQLYTWGWNGYGQLLLPEDTKVQETPRLYTSDSYTFSSVRCGAWSTFAFI